MAYLSLSVDHSLSIMQMTAIQKSHLQTGNRKNPEPAQMYIFKLCFPAVNHCEKHFKEVLLSISADLSS